MGWTPKPNRAAITRLTREFLAAKSLPAETIIPWRGRYGGYRDCDVLANVEKAWPTS
jgi:hypothetical protein